MLQDSKTRKLVAEQDEATWRRGFEELIDVLYQKTSRDCTHNDFSKFHGNRMNSVVMHRGQTNIHSFLFIYITENTRQNISIT